MTPCPSDEDLAARLKSARDHATACARCGALLEARVSLPGDPGADAEWMRSDLRARLLALAPPQRARRSFPFPSPWIAAAAACLLAAAGLSWHFLGLGMEPGPAAGAAGDTPAACPFGTYGEDLSPDRSRLFGRGSLLTLRRGSRVRLLDCAGDDPVTILIESGSARIEAAGEPLLVRIGETGIRLERALVVIEAGDSPATASLLLRNAHAEAGPAWRLVVLEGEAGIPGGTVRTGQEARGGGGETLVSDATLLRWTGEEAWREVSGLPAPLPLGESVLGEAAAGDYVWEAVLLCGESEGVSVLARLEGGAVAVPLGESLVRAGTGPLRVRVTVQAGWIRLEAGGGELFRMPVPECRSRFPQAGSGCGLKSWAGRTRVLQARWRNPI